MTRYKRKSRSSEAAKTKEFPMIPIITRNDVDYANDSYIFSKKVDRFIDSLCPWVLGLTVLYFAIHIVYAIFR